MALLVSSLKSIPARIWKIRRKKLVSVRVNVRPSENRTAIPEKIITVKSVRKEI
jgi:hypothetical protein